MTIGELIEKLNGFNPDSPIVVCDENAKPLKEYQLEVTEFDGGYTIIYPWNGVVIEK